MARRNVLECLNRADGPIGALEVAQETQLSTLVVVPLLGELMADALVSRTHRAADGNGRGQSWRYQLTARGAREVAHAERRPA